MLNGQCSSWSSVLAGVLQASILGPLLFRIYINDLPENLQYTVKLFADDTSLFSTVYGPNISASQLKSDLKKNFMLGIRMENDLQSLPFQTSIKSYIF